MTEPVERLAPARYWQLALASSLDGLVATDPWEAAAAVCGRLASRGVVLAVDKGERDKWLAFTPSEVFASPDWKRRFSAALGEVVIQSVEDFDRLVAPPPAPREETPEEVGQRIGLAILDAIFRPDRAEGSSRPPEPQP